MNSFPPQFQPTESLERAFTLPSATYHSLDIYDKELEQIFGKIWQWVGHSSEIEEVGRFLTAKLGVDPIVVVRTEEGYKGFYNVCKHRGGPLVKDQEKSGKLNYNAFICQYHGWTYRLNGELRGVPAFDRAELFEKSDFALESIAIQEWNGGLFACKSDKDKLAELTDVLAGIIDRMDGINVEDYRFHQRMSYPIKCNWKVYVDNFLEGYHIPIVHPELAQLIDYKRYVTEIHGWHSLQHAPFRSGENVYQSTDGQAWYWFVFPNIMLNILPGRMQVNVIEPNGPKDCVVHFDYYYTDIAKAIDSGLVKDDLAYSETIQQEDIEICEAVQQGLASPAYEKGRFSPNREAGVWHFQQLYKAVMGKNS